MSASLGFYLNLDRCVACHACAVACKAHHALAPGIHWRRLVTLWVGDYPTPLQRTISYTCLHCEQPSCVAACPTGAIVQREDGIVLVDREACIGCQACAAACPYNVPQFDADGEMSKCDLCAERLAQGLRPACTDICPSEALLFGPLDALAARAAQEQGATALRLPGPNRPTMLVASARWAALEPLLPWT